MVLNRPLLLPACTLCVGGASPHGSFACSWTSILSVPATARIPRTGPAISQIKMEKEEPDWEDHLDPMESSAGPLTDR
ncbi:hypothetical protein GDO86_018050, partial [Hymenochirus boettgeri]